MNRDGQALAVDDAIARASALSTKRVDVVEHLPRADRSDLVRVVPLSPRRLVARVTRNIAGRSDEVGIAVNAESQPTGCVAEVIWNDDGAVIERLVAAVRPPCHRPETRARHRSEGQAEFRTAQGNRFHHGAEVESLDPGRSGETAA